MKKVIIFSLIVLSLLIILSFVMMNSCYAKGHQEIKSDNSDKIDYVPNEETAVKVAEAILYTVYGENIYQQKPFVVTLENEIYPNLRNQIIPIALSLPSLRTFPNHKFK